MPIGHGVVDAQGKDRSCSSNLEGQRVIDGDELRHPCRFYATKTEIESEYLEHSLELKKWSQKEAPVFDDPQGSKFGLKDEVDV